MNDLCPCCKRPFPPETVIWNPEMRQLLADGRAVYLPPKQGFLFGILWRDRHNGSGLSSEVLAARLYGEHLNRADGGPLNAAKIVNIYIFEIRRKMREIGITSITIPNLYGKQEIGYRLVIDQKRSRKAA